MSFRAATAGMTLVELLVAIAITSVISLAGWRAIDVLERARDQAAAEARRWQTLDRLFESLEADLRRADFQGLSASPTGLRFRLLALAPGDDAVVIEYVPRPDTAGRWHLDRIGGGSGVRFNLDAELPRFEFSTDGKAWQTSVTAYPLALRMQVRFPGSDADITRLWVLR